MTKDTSAWPFMINYLPEECLLTAEKELNETPETKSKALKELNSKIKDSNVLNDINFEQDYLVQFLRISKFNVDVAFNRIKKYINSRKKHPIYFTGVGDKICSNTSYSWATPLPYRSKSGSCVFLFKFGMWTVNEIPYEDLQRITLLCLHGAIRNPVTQIRGFQVIFDFQGSSLRQLQYGTPKNMLEVAQIYLESSTARFKYFHCINGTLPMKLIFAVIWPFMSEKMKNRVIFHKNTQTLTKYIDREALPVEYGGELENYYNYKWMEEANYQMSKLTLGGQRNLF